jgi:hypothetical protein
MANTNLNARWSLVVSRETDKALRQFLAEQGGGRKGDLSRFVEEAVCTHMLELAAATAKKNNAKFSEQEIEDAIDEALVWSRQ